MIFRLSLKLATKIKVGKLTEMPLHANELSDWSGNVFNVGRTQYIILSNTKSLYSCLMLAKGVTNRTTFVERTVTTIDEFLRHDGQSLDVDRRIAPPSDSINFARAHSRSVIGSTNDLIFGAKLLLADGFDRHEVASRLNETPLKALTDRNGRKYANPREVFGQLSTGEPACVTISRSDLKPTMT